MDPDEYLAFAADLSDPEVVSAYDELPLWSSLAGRLLLRHVPLRAAARVLDVGCGTGFPLLELAQRMGPGAHVTGIDVWDAALERARRKASTIGVTNVEIRHADAAAMPFDDGAFDLVVSNLGVNNFSDPARALSECRRVLATGGTIALTTNLQGHMREFYDVFDETLREAGDNDAIHRLRVHIDHRTTVARLSSALETAGFELAKVVEESETLRFADGSALLRHYLIKLGFLDAWKRVVAVESQAAVFSRLEQRLNEIAGERGEIVLTIPLAYVEGRAR